MMDLGGSLDGSLGFAVFALLALVFGSRLLGNASCQETWCVWG